MPQLCEDNYTNVYINNIDYSIGDSELKELCEKALGIKGCVTSVVVFKARNKNSSAYGFCNFSSHEYAKRAIEKINSMNHTIRNKKISASRAIGKDQRTMYKQQLYGSTPDDNVNLYVKNFEMNIDEEDLRKAFEPYGTITNVRIIRHSNGFSRGFGFVSFQSHEEAQRAIDNMDGKTLDHRTISVTFYTPKSSHESSPIESAQSSPIMSPTMASTTPAPLNTWVVPSIYNEVGQAATATTTRVSSQPSMDYTPFRVMRTTEHETSKRVTEKKERDHGICLNNLKYVTDENEVKQYFYDFDSVKVEKVNNHRGIFTGTWKVLFKTEREANKALDICKYLTVRSRPVHAELLGYSSSCYCGTPC